MNLKNAIRVGDRVKLLSLRIRTPTGQTITVREIKPASMDDWMQEFRGTVCAWDGIHRWPISLCVKVEQ